MSMPVGEARERLSELAQRHEALGGIFDVDGLRLQIDRLNDHTLRPGFWDDAEAAQKVVQEKAAIEAVVTKYEKLQRETKDLGDLLEMADGDESVIDEVIAQIPELEKATRQMEVARMLAGKTDRSDAIVTIHPGTGGVDAQDWAEMLLRMYLRWCEKKGYKTEIVDQQAGEQAGIKGATIHVRGPFAYGYLRAENGVHRLIRISPFDANARRQTAFASLEVVPDLDDDVGEIEIKPEDLQVDTFRAGGKGGQHVNKTESAIRITHIPSGVIVACQAERSQHKNRATAMKMLRGKLYELERQKREAEFQANYGVDKMESGFGSQVRTYTLAPYRLVKDERTEFKTGAVDAVLDGDLDDLIEAYLMKTADQRKKKDEAATAAAQ
ncbi:peptide chain release factor 2 [Sandaracinus amylolyticus]|uniref:peptide chain release factor 2 n=1 Tax=Sandaracinus amylolyticus TaxID=927083 RepID=UPI003AF3D11F